jgi:hypothetical protein
MKKKKFPYVNCTQKELDFMEKRYFLIMGRDFVSENEYCMFTENQMAKLYNKILDGLAEMIDSGDSKEKEIAISMIGSLRIVPVRIH